MAAIDYTRLSESEVEQFYAYGFAQYNQGNWSEAADVFRLLCTRRPMEPRFWFGLAATLQESGSYVDAVHAWAMTALLKDEDPLPHYHAAECYFSLKNTQEGAKALQLASTRALENHPLNEKIALLRERWEAGHG